MRVTDKKFIILFTVLIAAWFMVYFNALESMEATWRRSETFAHGYLILPIVIWIFWQKKQLLKKSVLAPTWLPMPFFIGATAIGLLGYAADADIASQLAAIFSVIFLIWLLVGNALVWQLKFPLFYLFFMVPMGENVIPWLQHVTAWFTVSLLKLNGIPVFNDGLYIQIPSGTFEVAVACSGIRYLIASVAIGTLFAYLSFNSFKKQILFTIFATLLSIVANGVRAYGIVAIAYYSDMKYAVGVDHIIYGWLFFGVITLLMFYVGGKFSDKEDIGNDIPLVHSASKNPPIRWMMAIVLTIFALQIALYSQIKITSIPLSPLPAIITSTQYTSSEDKDWGIIFNTSVQKSMVISKQGLTIFRAVYAQKQNKGELINWDNKVYNPKRWSIKTSKTMMICQHKAVVLLLHDSIGRERLVAYWYKIDDHFYVSKLKIKLAQALKTLISPRSTAEIMAYSQKGRNIKEFVKAIEHTKLLLASKSQQFN